MTETETHVLFWGGPFSNFYEAPFQAEGHSFKTSEQYFMWKKAMTFGDEETAALILAAETPKEAKKLGRKVKGYDDGIWAEKRESIMEEGCYRKYTSNPALKKMLLSYPDKEFVEASPYDKIWGIGLGEEEAARREEKEWPGQNLLGKVLGRVRDRIKREEA